MKYNEENIKKLREGKATLVADHSKPEFMGKVLRKAFPEDPYEYKALAKYKYYFKKADYEWYFSDECGVSELIPLSYFFESEEDEFIEPLLIKAGSDVLGLGISKTPPKVDCRVISECNYQLLLSKKNPKTAEERDQIVKELQAMEFKKEFPSELEHELKSISSKEHILIALLRMRDVYRDGWVSDTTTSIDNICVDITNDKLHVERYRNSSTPLSFQNKETAELFLSNFKEELESVKSLIS